MQSPCKDCDNRGCGAYHDQCKLYQDYIKESNKLKDTIRLSKIAHKSEYVKDDTYRSRGNKLFLFRKER